MAWVRTATTLITFGFALQKLFQDQKTAGTATEGRLLGPHNLALLMIGIGLAVLVIATLEHRRDLNALKADYPGIPRSLARVLAALVSILGIWGSFLHFSGNKRKSDTSQRSRHELVEPGAYWMSTGAPGVLLGSCGLSQRARSDTGLMAFRWSAAATSIR